MSTTAQERSESATRLAARLLVELRKHPKAKELTQHRMQRMASVLSRRLRSVTVVLENLWDSHNASAVIRTAEGLGLDAVHVVEDPNPYKRHADIVRGADRWLHVDRCDDLPTRLEELHTAGFVTCAADVGRGCLPLPEVPVDRPIALVFGSEHDGLSPRARALSDLHFTIPMSGFTRSFNVSVSAAIALYDLTARRRSWIGSESDLSEAELAKRGAAWIDRLRQRPSARSPAADDR